MSPVSLWFDPACPYTWITSRWLNDVAQQRDFTIMWRPFSLALLHADNPQNRHAARHAQTFRMLRVAQALREITAAAPAHAGSPGACHGNVAVGAFYTAVGVGFHELYDPDRDPKRDTPEFTDQLIRVGLKAAQEAVDGSTAELPVRKLTELTRAADDERYDDAISASTSAALKLTGKGVGLPIVGIGETAFFGPVLKARPRGHAALDLWDAFTILAANPDFAELKRTVRKPYSFA